MEYRSADTLAWFRPSVATRTWASVSVLAVGVATVIPPGVVHDIVGVDPLDLLHFLLNFFDGQHFVTVRVPRQDLWEHTFLRRKCCRGRRVSRRVGLVVGCCLFSRDEHPELALRADHFFSPA
jgi:hypothetical protein